MIGNWRQRRMRLLFAVAICACGIALLRPGVAHAGWPLSAGGSVALGFGATYQGAEATSSSVHRGVDITAEKGAAVRAPLAGRVSFVGRVPAVGGGTVRAVTIATASGSITLLPLSSAGVAKGESLSEGDRIGTVAGEGDGSSSGVHLHVGVKRGDLYVDPLSVFSIPAVGSSTAHPAAGGAPAHAGAAARAKRAGAPSSARARVSSVGGGASAPLRQAVPGASLAPGVSVARAAGSGALAPAASGGAASPAGVGTLGAPHAQAPARQGGAATASGPTVPQVAARLGQLAASAVKGASLGLLGVLAGLAALWPLWRREQRKGLGEVGVSATGDDVAAVVGR